MEKKKKKIVQELDKLNFQNKKKKITRPWMKKKLEKRIRESLDYN